MHFINICLFYMDAPGGVSGIPKVHFTEFRATIGLLIPYLSGHSMILEAYCVRSAKDLHTLYCLALLVETSGIAEQSGRRYKSAAIPKSPILRVL